MAEHPLSLLSLLALLLFAFGSHGAASWGVKENTDELKTYIIRVRAPESFSFGAPVDIESYYRSFLPPSIRNSSASRYLYSYTDAITGFAARMTTEELSYVESKEGFVARHADRILPLLTTHTPSFLGLKEGNGPWNNSNMGKGVIIGLLDTGIEPGHPSFGDEGMAAPPSKWKGKCNFKRSSKCSKKVIGARAFVTQGGLDASACTADDDVGHGTYTASIAAGTFVGHATVIGNAHGVASGMAPRAHIAMYKVCSGLGCSQADVLAGMDAAIKDGVDVLSLSLGGATERFYNDVVAMGAFNAVKKGVFVACAAGNSGPARKSTTHEAPWVLTVGAAATDRRIRAVVKLGDDQEFQGESAFQPSHFSSDMRPLIYPAGGDCNPSSLAGKVKGKVVVCKRDFRSRTEIGREVRKAGGKAMILINGPDDKFTSFADPHYLPAVHLNYVDGQKVVEYATRAARATAKIIFKGTIYGVSPAPTMSFFTARGPSTASPRILKPDISGPGVNILGAWPFHVGPARRNYHSNKAASFNMLSGTSASTSHLSGIAALLKIAHPEWSPAVIKSAMMTSSNIFDLDGKPIKDERDIRASYFTLGAGIVNPTSAVDPGLVYDLSADDYIAYLCAIKYTDEQVEAATHQKVNCKKYHKSLLDLNYPAIGLDVDAERATLTRTVTNVGPAKSKYRVKVENIVNPFNVKVTPEVLEFSEVNEKKSYKVTMNWNSNITHGEGNLWWISDTHSVRTTIMLC